jgi:hypothetical protein
MAIQPQITAGGSRRRLLLLLLAGVGAIGIALLVAGPLQHSRRAAEPAPATVARPVPTTTVPAQMSGPSTTLGTGSGTAAAATKDPFRPLVTPEAAGTGAAVAAATPTTGQAVQSTVPGAGAGTASTPGGGAVAAEQQVALVGIVTESGARAARVEVDGTRYTVAEGDTFAGSYRAVDIGSSCATFESDSTPFTLCEGEAVLK